MKVKDCMCKRVISASKDSSIKEISSLMKEYDIGSVPICDDNKNIIGILTDRDIVLRGVAENKNLDVLTAGDIMTQNHIIKLDINATTLEASKTMSNNQIRRFLYLKIINLLALYL